MLLLKITIVPLFIGLVTLAGRRWGAGVAGLLGGLPVVAGPIVVFVALEQGPQFGALTATAAIAGIAGLLVFGLAYAWASTRWSWPAALCCGVLAWFVCALGLAALPARPETTLLVAAIALLATPRALPPGAPSPGRASLRDLPYRMATGALLTIGVTAVAATVGEVWSGLLAVFPILGLVLAVFTHRGQGARQVAFMYRGMVKGLYSFAAFFLALALLWPRMEFWGALAAAIGAGIVVQAAVQWLAMPRRELQPTR